MNNQLPTSLMEILRQGEGLLRSLTDEQYIESVPQAFSSCVGSHYRHSLEHFEPLLTTRPGDLVDYDARKRDPHIETDRGVALDRTLHMLTLAEQLDPADMDRPLQVRCSVSADVESPVVDSTLGREIMYAVIHAVHHYAIIRMMCNLLDIEQPEGFGVAPSTTRHQRTLANS